jgi:hypothetical protein
VKWLDTLSRAARFRLLFRSRVTNGMVDRLRGMVVLGKSLRGVASFRDHVTILQSNESDGAVDLSNILRDGSKDTMGSRTNPRDKLQASEDKDLDRIWHWPGQGSAP